MVLKQMEEDGGGGVVRSRGMMLEGKEEEVLIAME